jgi:hypothetical protein
LLYFETRDGGFSTNTATLIAAPIIESIDAVLTRTSWKETPSVILPCNT